jgi:hypothetical protein
MEALLDLAEKGELEELPDDAEMQKARAELSLWEAHIEQAYEEGRPGGILRQMVELRNQLVLRVQLLDLDRRIDLTKVPVFDTPAQGAAGRLRTILFSRGMGETLSGTSKWLGRLGTAAACVLMIGVASPAIARMGIEPALDRLVDLQVLRSEAAARATLQQIAAPTATAPSTPPVAREEDDAVYVRAAEQFMRALAASPAWEEGVVRSRPNDPVAARTVSAADAAEEAAVRESILRIDASGEGARRQIEPAPLGGSDARAQPALQRYERYRARLADGARPSAWSDAVQRIALWLEAAGRRSPAIEARIRAGIASFSEPRLASDFATDAIGEFVSAAVKQALPTPSGGASLAQPIGGGTTKTLQTAATRLTERKLAQFLNGLSSGADYASAIRAVGAADAGDLVFRRAEAGLVREVFSAAEADRQAIAAALLENPPSLVERLPAAQAESMQRAARAAAGSFASTDAAAIRRSLEGYLGTYEDLFAGQGAAQSQTPLGRALGEAFPSATDLAAVADSLDRAGGGDAAGAHRRGAPAARSRNFARMSSSFRVGGVVIGAMSAGRARLDYTDLVWAREGSGFRLALIGRNGARHELGSFPGATIQQALAYAADGRVTTVTMTSGAPDGRLRIHVHPALVNTELGRSFIVLDTFVDAAMEEGSTVDRWRRRVFGQLQAYSAAFQLAAPQAAPGESRDFPFHTPAEVARLFAGGWKLDDPRQSFFAHHEGRFDANLVQRIVECGTRPGVTQEAFRSCIAAARIDTVRFRYQEGTVWSGVRERQFPPGADAFALANGNPLRFMLQVAFAPQAGLKAAIIPVTPLQQNCTLLWCTKTMRGAFVDPGGDLDRLKAAAKQQGVTIEKIILTHGHIDHCGGANPRRGAGRADRRAAGGRPLLDRAAGG